MLPSPCESVYGFTDNNEQRNPQAEGAKDSEPAVGTDRQGIGIKLGIKFGDGLPLNQQRPAHQPAQRHGADGQQGANGQRQWITQGKRAKDQ